jgi:hypothetical protein
MYPRDEVLDVGATGSSPKQHRMIRDHPIRRPRRQTIWCGHEIYGLPIVLTNCSK